MSQPKKDNHRFGSMLRATETIPVKTIATNTKSTITLNDEPIELHHLNTKSGFIIRCCCNRQIRGALCEPFEAEKYVGNDTVGRYLNKTVWSAGLCSISNQDIFAEYCNPGLVSDPIATEYSLNFNLSDSTIKIYDRFSKWHTSRSVGYGDFSPFAEQRLYKKVLQGNVRPSRFKSQINLRREQLSETGEPDDELGIEEKLDPDTSNPNGLYSMLLMNGGIETIISFASGVGTVTTYIDTKSGPIALGFADDNYSNHCLESAVIEVKVPVVFTDTRQLYLCHDGEIGREPVDYKPLVLLPGAICDMLPEHNLAMYEMEPYELLDYADDKIIVSGRLDYKSIGDYSYYFVSTYDEEILTKSIDGATVSFWKKPKDNVETDHDHDHDSELMSSQDVVDIPSSNSESTSAGIGWPECNVCKKHFEIICNLSGCDHEACETCAQQVTECPVCKSPNDVSCITFI